MANPTNNVRVIVEDASGCWASAPNAAATARPWPSPGPTAPMAMVSPAERIDAAAMIVMLSILSPCLGCLVLGLPVFGTGSGCDVNQGQDAKNIGLDHTG